MTPVRVGLFVSNPELLDVLFEECLNRGFEVDAIARSAHEAMLVARKKEPGSLDVIFKEENLEPGTDMELEPDLFATLVRQNLGGTAIVCLGMNGENIELPVLDCKSG
jgi:hypothetical protein